MRIFQRIKSCIVRYKKARDNWGFLARWNKACDKNWKRLFALPYEEKRFNQLMSHHEKLLGISGRRLECVKNDTITNWKYLALDCILRCGRK